MISVRKVITAVAVFSMLLTACGAGEATSTPVDPNAVSTSLVGTMVASLFLTHTALAPTAVPTSTATPMPLPTFSIPTVVTPTATYGYLLPIASITPSVTGTVYTPTTDPNSLASGCNNLAFVRDVTIPSGTVLKPGEDFHKTWKVANTGTCNWMFQYSIFLVSGPAMNGKTFRLGRIVTAGHWDEIGIGLGAPKAPGTYTASWRMADANGVPFGSTLDISIVVSGSSSDTDTPAPAPTDTTAPPTATPTP